MLLKTKLVLPALLTLPARSVAVALTLTVPCPSTSRSAALSSTACATPLPVRLLLSVWPLALKFTSSAVPGSATALTAPPALLASTAFSVAAAATSTGAAGASVSSTKLALTGALLCPAAVAVALTLIVPLPSLARSVALSSTGVAPPVPLRLLLTLCPLAEKTTLTALPTSAVTLTAPELALARAALAKAASTDSTGVPTTLASLRMKLAVPALLTLPAASVAVALTATLKVPLPRMARSAAVSATGCWSPTPAPLRVLLTVWPLALKRTRSVAPLSPDTLTAPAALVATATVSMLAEAITKGAAGATVSTVTVPLWIRLKLELSSSFPLASRMLPPLSTILVSVLPK